MAALIIDSPWLPGYCGISHFEYYLSPAKWLAANLRAEQDFPGVVFLPGFWVEYGMATEASAFGTRISWWPNMPPSVHPVLGEEAVNGLTVPKPAEDGLMPFVLHLYRELYPEIKRRGQEIKVVAARGPLAVASHLRGLTGLLMDLKLQPEQAKLLLDITTETVIAWLKAQIAAVPSAEGIMLLDDVVGMISPGDYLEFAHERLRHIFSEFAGYLKIYHNDANVLSFAVDLAKTGLDVLNFSHNHRLSQVRERMGPEICLLGNVPPLEILTRGRPDDVGLYVGDMLGSLPPDFGRLVVSAGGGAPPGMPGENLAAMADAAKAG